MRSEQVIAFRLGQHHLLKPLPISQLEEAAASGIQITSPGTLAMALGIRIRDFSLSALQTALSKRRLVEITGIRGAGYVIPTADFNVFTRAAFPTHEKGLEHLLGPAWKVLRSKKISASDAIRQVTQVLLKSLNGRSLTQTEIHEKWRAQLPKELLNWCKGCESFHVQYSLVAAVGIQGSYCFGPIKDGNTAYVRADQWLDLEKIDSDLEKTRETLVKRFLRFYGPSTSKGFATWAGLSTAEAKDFWELVENDLIEIDGPTGPSWILKSDRPKLESPSSIKGFHLLPPRDPFLNLPDREVLVEKKRHSQIWRMVGNPGVILIQGQVAGVWKMQKKLEKLVYTFEPFGKIPKSIRDDIQVEATRFAHFRECSSVQISWK